MGRMRILIFAGLLLLLTLVSSAAEKQYIVYLRSDTPVLHEKQDGMPAFSVVNEDALRALQNENAVLWYEEDAEVVLHGSVGYSDPYYAKKWDLTMIAAQSAWTAGYMGDGITIGVIDSGAQADHPDLAENLLPGVCYLDDVNAATDTIGHGTFVSGMIAAGINGIGSIGVAPKAKIQPLKCFEAGVETKISMIIPAIYDAVDKYGCRILNMSLGSTTPSQTLKDAIDYALEKGCIVVASVGNDGKTDLYYPAAYPGVIGVGSVNKLQAVSSRSQRNESVSLVAPGEDVYSDYIGGRCIPWSGTSFAAPLVSGAAALLLCRDPAQSPSDMEALLTRSAVRLGTDAYSTSYGYGLLHIGRAMRSLEGLSGDIDRDGEITAKDALLLLKALLNAESLPNADLADLNRDGSITLHDVLLLLRAATA